MNSLIARAAVRPVRVVLFAYAVLLLLRGHHLPGGGFIAGLVAASAYLLHLLTHDAAALRRTLVVSPSALVGAGLAVALGSGLVGGLAGRPFLTGRWTFLDVEQRSGALGTPLLFDVGVCLVVVGFTLTLALAAWEAE